MNYFRQSTPSNFRIGPFVESDGITPDTSLEISASDVRLSKNGDNFISKNDSTSATHDESGFYNVAFDGTDLNTTGSLRMVVEKGGSLVVWEDFTVLPPNVFDALVSGTDTIDSTIVSATSAATSVITDDIFAKMVDTKTFEEIMEILLSMATGKIERTNNKYTYYKQDNTTELYTLKSERSKRTRL